MRSLAFCASVGLVGSGLLGLAALASTAAAMPVAGLQPGGDATPDLIRVEYFCSPGFVPTYGGQCVATLARDEIELYVNEPRADDVVVTHRHRRHHGLRARF